MPGGHEAMLPKLTLKQPPCKGDILQFTNAETAFERLGHISKVT